MIARSLRKILIALLISLGIGLAIGTWLRLSVLEARPGSVYIG